PFWGGNRYNPVTTRKNIYERGCFEYHNLCRMAPTKRKKVDFIFFDAGGGHRAAANALRLVMEDQGRPFEIRMVNLQEMLDSIDVFRKLTGIRLQDLYNLMLKKGWTLGSPQLMAGMQAVI